VGAENIKKTIPSAQVHAQAEGIAFSGDGGIAALLEPPSPFPRRFYLPFSGKSPIIVLIKSGATDAPGPGS
jgi:hypothetical protein